VTRLQTVRLVEISDTLGVTHQRASKIVDEPGSPAPVGSEGQRRLWNRREVTAWAKVLPREKPWRLSRQLGATRAGAPHGEPAV
jgi:hypothetical protein